MCWAKRCILTLLVALLPLHGFAAALMASSMAAKQLAAVPAASQQTSNQDTSGRMPCHQAEGTTASVDASHADASTGMAPTAECADCVACAACHTSALAVNQAAAPSIRALSAQPQFVASNLASPSLAQPAKPPKNLA